MVIGHRRSVLGALLVAFAILAATVIVGGFAEPAHAVPVDGDICAVVTDAATTDPLEGVSVEAFDSAPASLGTKLTDVEGKACWTHTVDLETINFEATDPDAAYYDNTGSGDVEFGSTVDVPIALSPITGGATGLIVNEADGAPIDATLTATALSDATVYTATFAATGAYTLSHLPPDTYDFEFSWTAPPDGDRLFRSDASCFYDTEVVVAASVVNIDWNLRSFCDVRLGSWYFGSVEAIALAGITNGYPDGTYRPGDLVQRSETAAFLVKALGETVTPPTVPPFTDVPTDIWYAGYVDKLKELGITDGYPDGTYGPDLLVNRGEMAKLLAVALGLTPTVPTENPFIDVPFDQWYAGYVEVLAQEGIIAGYPDGTFRPENKLQRSHIASLLERAFLTP